MIDETEDGVYATSDVALTIDGEQVSKGDGAGGEFVRIERRGTVYGTTTGADGSVTRWTKEQPKALLTITTQRGSSAARALAMMRAKGMGTLSVLRTHTPPKTLIDGNAWVENYAPRDGHHPGEQIWDLVKPGG